MKSKNKVDQIKNALYVLDLHDIDHSNPLQNAFEVPANAIKTGTKPVQMASKKN